MGDDYSEPYQYSDTEYDKNYNAPPESDISDDVTKSLNAIVLQYLDSVGLHGSTKTFIEECTECGMPLPEGAQHRSYRNSEFSTRDADFLLNAFDEYDGDLLWQLWERLSGNFDLSTANEFTRASFNVRLFVSLIPFYLDMSIEEKNESMASLRLYFDEKTNSNAVDEETLSLFALPYVKDPNNHSIFKKLFEQSWRASVKDSIIQTFNAFQEKNKLTSQSRTDLAQMFVNCSGLVDEISLDEGSEKTCDMCSCKIPRSRTATLNFTSGAHLSNTPYSEAEANKSTVVGTNRLFQKIHHLTEQNRELYNELRKDGERYLQLMKVSNRLVQSLELAVLGKSLDLIQLKQDIETAIPGIFVGIPLDKRLNSRESLCTALRSAETSRVHTALSAMTYANYHEPEPNDYNGNGNDNNGDINLNVKLVLEGYDEEGSPYDFEVECEPDFPYEKDTIGSNKTNHDKRSQKESGPVSYRTVSSTKSPNGSVNDLSQVGNGNESSTERERQIVRKQRSKKALVTTEIESDQGSVRARKIHKVLNFNDMDDSNKASESEGEIIGKQSSREVQVKANKIRKIRNSRNKPKQGLNSKIGANSGEEISSGRQNQSSEDRDSARSLKQFDIREQQLLENPSDSFDLEALAPKKEHLKYRRSIPDPTVDLERIEKNVILGGNMTYRMEEQVNTRKNIAPSKKEKKDRPIISAVASQLNKPQSDRTSKIEKPQVSKPVARKKWTDAKQTPEILIHEPKIPKDKERTFNKVTAKILTQAAYLQNNPKKTSNLERSPRQEKLKVNSFQKLESPRNAPTAAKKRPGVPIASPKNPDSGRNKNKHESNDRFRSSSEIMQPASRASTGNPSPHPSPSSTSAKPSPSKVKPFQWISASKYDLPLPAQSNHNHSADAGFISRPRVPRSP